MAHRPRAWLPCLCLALVGALALGGCAEPAECTNVDGTRTDSELFTHRHHCSVCGIACTRLGVPEEFNECLPPSTDRDSWTCGLKAGWHCAPGYHRRRVRGECDCFGPSPDDCQPCQARDVPHTGLDEDCDLRVDETVDNWLRRPLPPNGPLGALPEDRGVRVRLPTPATRTTCGPTERACVLPAGADDVDCEVDGPDATCRAVGLPADGPVAERAFALSGQESDCADGIDDDGNGVIDDGPTCQTLVASVASPECHGQGPDVDCPASHVPLDPSHVRLPLSDKPLVAAITYDVLIDNDEATLAQVQRFLNDTGRCVGPVGQRHPLCDVTEDPALPAGGLDWCVAYDYCQWAGKRLPTELEWLRAFGGTAGAPATGASCAEGGQTPDCGAEGPRTVGQTGGHTTKGLHHEAVLHDALGNVAEWMFDAHLEPCEAPWADCDRPEPRAIAIPIDPVLHAPEGDLRRARILRGGGWAGELGSGSIERRQFADPGVEVTHYGVRCAQTFRPMRESLPWVKPIEEVPYDWTATSNLHAQCRAQPRTARIAPRTLPYRLSRAVNACVPDQAPTELQEFVSAALLGETPLLFNVTDEGGGAATMAIETGLASGAEAFWLEAREPTRTFVDEGCTPFGCRFDRSAEPGHISMPSPTGELVPLPLRGMRPLNIGALYTCLAAVPFEDTAWRLDLRLPREALAAVFVDGNRVLTACGVLECDDPDVSTDRCAAECTGWRLPVDVQLSRLVVP